MSTYKLNPDFAKEGDSTGGSRINDTGAYTGVITLAHEFKSRTGTKGIEFLFKSDCGKEATLSLYVENTSGEVIYGAKVFHALLACLKLREVGTQQIQAELYDYDSNGMKKQMVEAFPMINGKRIGLVLQRENYVNNNGEDKHRMLMFCPFDAETQQTATEVLENKQAEALPKIIDSCKDKQAKPRNTQQSHTGSKQEPVAVDDFDDDIPF